MRKSKSAFTIVELLIVIVVIAILAAITIVAYNGIQVRARDAQRSNDVSVLLKALENYRTINGVYPTATPTVGDGGWESSYTDASNPANFMEYLELSKRPIDPVNNSTNRYRYYKYPAGNGGCATSRGGYMVLVAQFESSANKPTGNSVSCPSYSLSDGGSIYIMVKFDNE